MSKTRSGLAVGLSVLVTTAAACSSFSADVEPVDPADASSVEGSAVDGGADVEGGPACNPSTLSTDPQNCGACGHSCLGGTCQESACQPFVFASLAKRPIGFALEDSLVVWSDGTTIFHCPKTGCSGTPTSTPGSSVGYTDLAAEGAFAFFVSGGGVNGHIGRLDSTDTYARLGSAFGYPFRIAAHGNAVVALNLGNDSSSGLYYAAGDTLLSATRIARFLPTETAERNWGFLTTNGTQAFAADYGTIAGCALPSCTEGWSIAAGNSPSIIQGVTGLAATSTDLYWTSLSPPLLNSCPIVLGGAGCGVGAIVATNLPAGAAPHDIFLAEGRLFVAAGETLGSCTPPACDSTWKTHVSGLTIRGRAAADATAIYWIMYDTATPADAGADAGAPPPPTNVRLMKLAK